MAHPTPTRLLMLTTAMTLSLAANQSSALPTGGSVAYGTATISTSGKETTVAQTTSKAIINWTGFNTASGETVQINDPSSSSITLNRVSGAATSFNGALNSNANVWVINPSGVAIGSTGTVNTAGFLASTSAITNANFTAGTYSFTPGGGATGATVSNAGKITLSQAGLAALVGPNVANSGTITAKTGVITLASGDAYTVDLTGDGLINLSASSAMKAQTLTNTGTLNASGGSVVFTAAQASSLLDNLINLDGVVEANSLTASNQSGDLTYDATFSGSTGGTVALSAYRNVTFDDVQIAPTSGKLNVTLDSNDTGAAAGGSIYVASGAGINSNGGNITLGGGTNPLTGYAVGDTAPGTDSQGNRLYANGIFLDGSVISLLADGGNITLNGKGTGLETESGGVFINSLSGNNANQITTSGTGTLTIRGIGANSSVYSYGVTINQTALTAANGAINVTGTSGVSASEEGLYTYNSANFTTGAGAITLSGSTYANSAATTADYATGLILVGGTVETTSGAIAVKGIAGAQGNTVGVYLLGGTSIFSNTGGINISATAGNALGSSEGLEITGSDVGTQTTAAGYGNVSIAGTDGVASSSGTNFGIYLTDFSGIGASGGSIQLTGKDVNASASSTGLLMDTDSNVNVSGTGNIKLTGSGSVAYPDLSFVQGSGFPGGANTVQTTTGNLTLVADNMNLSDLAAQTTTGSLIFQPYTASTSIGVAGGAGTLSIGTGVLNNFTAANFVFGSTTDTGALTVGGFEWGTNAPTNVKFLNGTGNITLTGITSTYPGQTMNITIATDGDFINEAGAGALAPGGNGRFLIYTQSPAYDTLDGIVTNFQLSGCTYGQSCPTLPKSGNGLVFSN